MAQASDQADDLTSCAQLVERGDAERFRATMAAPPAARAALFPIYAFNLEVSRAPWVTQEPMIAEMRLQWWRDALEEIREGGPVRRHEVATPLAKVLDATGAELLDALIDARRWDIQKEPFEDEADFRAYIEATSANLLLAATRALAPHVPEAPVRKAGHALGVANWLRAVPALEAAGRIPLVDGRPEAVRALAQDGLRLLAEARRERSAIPAAARPAMLAVWHAGPVLAAAARHPARVADAALDPAPFRDRLSLMARASTGFW
ncbi:MAG: squalene/phytoene synthase family protein [Roseovarius sp.]|jgi:phytoene synthase